MKINWIVLAAPFLLLECVPIPNRRTCAPLVAGTLLRGGAPVAGAEIQAMGGSSSARCQRCV